MSIDNIKKTVENFSNRLAWDEYFMSVAYLITSRSTCHRLHVGCIIVKDNRILSSGYNGFLPKAPHKSFVRNNHEQATVHAEQNAITDCAARGVMVKGGTAYITHYPCINCAKILAASGIISIKYHEDYKNDELVEKILDNVNISIEKI
jgi:dCMP deaminase